MTRPAFYVAAVFLAGSVAGRVLQVPPAFVAVLALIVFLAAVLLPRFGRPSEESPNVLRRQVLRLLLAALFCLGAWQQRLIAVSDAHAKALVDYLSDGRVITVRGTVVGPPESHGEQLPRLVLVLDDVQISPHEKGLPPSVALHRRLQISLVGDLPAGFADSPPLPGQGWTARCQLRPVESRPETDFFDYRLYLLNRGIVGRATVWRSDAFQRWQEGDKTWQMTLFGPIHRWRRDTARRIDRQMPAASAAILKAILLGDTTDLEWSQREVFARAGMAHLLAVSGLHTALIAAIVFFLFRLLLLPTRWSGIATLVALAVYLVITGFRPPVVRATLLAFCALLPLISGLRTDMLNSVALAAFLTAVLMPRALFRTDFQLSYMACFGLILLYPSLMECFTVSIRDQTTRRGKLLRFWNRWPARGLALAVGAQMALLPILSHLFARVSLVGFFSNAITVPWSAFVLGSGWAFAILGGIAPALQDSLAFIARVTTSVLVFFAEFLSSPRWAAIRMPAFPWWLTGLYYLLIYSGPGALRRKSPGALETRRSATWLRVAVVVGVLVWWPFLALYSQADRLPATELEVVTLDVGQGDCLVIRAGRRQTILVDTGPEGASRKVLQWLWQNGIDSIDAMILTHNDADHIGGAPDLIDALYVRKIFTSPLRAPTDVQSELDSTISEHNIYTGSLGRGDRIALLHGAVIDILHPAADDPDMLESNPARNEFSLVLKLQLKDMTFLLTGDATASTEDQLLDEIGAPALDAEILKVAHHGSRHTTSMRFLQAVTPDIALISVGRNAYGHPTRMYCCGSIRSVLKSTVRPGPATFPSPQTANASGSAPANPCPVETEPEFLFPCRLLPLFACAT